MGVKGSVKKGAEKARTGFEIDSKAIVVALMYSRGNHKGCPYRIATEL